MDKENIANNNNTKPHAYVPGDLTEPKHRFIDTDELVNKINTRTNSPKFSKIRDDFCRPSPEREKDISKEVKDFCNLNKEMIDAPPPSTEVQHKRKGRLLSPILAAISNFNLAKKLHRENLEHNPLPDTVTDRLYKKIQMQRKGEAGLSLEDNNFATGKFLCVTCSVYSITGLAGLINVSLKSILGPKYLV